MAEQPDDWDDWDPNPVEEPKTEEKINKRKIHFQSWEDEIVKEMWMTHTDEEISERLSRPLLAIYKRRKILGLHKPNGRPSLDTKKNVIFTNPTEYNLSRLSKEDRLLFYKNKFTLNPRYPWLLKTLAEDEIEYYKHKYIEMIDTLDSISLQEEDLLHNMVMKEIQIMRLQEQIKNQLDAFNGREEDEEGNKIPPPQYLYKDLAESEKQYVQYQEKLKLTREQRLKIDKEEKITIAGMVQNFLDASNRKKAGDMAGQMSYFTNRCKEEMSKMQFLLGEKKMIKSLVISILITFALLGTFNIQAQESHRGIQFLTKEVPAEPLTNHWQFIIDTSDSVNDIFNRVHGAFMAATEQPTDKLFYSIITFNNRGMERQRPWCPYTLEDSHAANEWINHELRVLSYGVAAIHMALEQNVDDLTIVLITDGGFTETCVDRNNHRIDEAFAQGQQWRLDHHLHQAIVCAIGLENIPYTKGHKPPDRVCQGYLRDIGHRYHGGYFLVRGVF